LLLPDDRLPLTGYSGGTKVLKGRRRRSGGRFTPISDELVALLKDHLKKQRRAVLQGRGEPEWVFSSPEGLFWMERNFSRMWERVRRKALPKGVRPLKFHCTRHTFITWALEAGTPVTRIAEWVGASVEVIEKNHRHVLPLDHADLSFTRVDRTKTEPKPNQTEPDRTKSARSGGIRRKQLKEMVTGARSAELRSKGDSWARTFAPIRLRSFVFGA